MNDEDKISKTDETRFNSLNANEFSQIMNSFQVMKKFISEILSFDSSDKEELEQLKIAVQNLECTIMSSRCLEVKQEQLFVQHPQQAPLGHGNGQILEPQVNHSIVENQISNPYNSTRILNEFPTEVFKEQPDRTEIHHSNDKFNLNSNEQSQVTEAIENLKETFNLSSAQDIIQKLQLVVNSHSEQRPFEPRGTNSTFSPNRLHSLESQAGKFKIHRNKRSNRSNILIKKSERAMKRIDNQKKREMENEKVYEARWNWRGSQN